MEKERKEIYWQLLKLIEKSTDFNGHIAAEYFKKELLIEIFPEIPFKE